MQQPELKAIQPKINNLPLPVTLDNGVEANIIPIDTCDLIAVTVMFIGGEWVQEKKLQSDFALRQLRSGAGELSSEIITEKLDFYGATLTSGAAISYSFVQVTALKRTLQNVLPLFRDILSSPAFEQRQLDYGIEEGIFSNNVCMQRVAEVCKRLFYTQVLGNENPAAQFADETDYRKLTRNDLLKYHTKYLCMDNAVVFLTGRIDESVISLVNKYVGSIPCKGNGGVSLCSAPIVQRENKYSETEINVPSVQSALRLGLVLPDFTHPDYPAMLFFGSVLGGYFGSRLMANIRERLGLTYGIGSTFHNIPGATVFITATETPRNSVEKCIEEVKKDIIDLQRNPIDDEEMALAKNYVLGQFCRMTETSYSLSTVMMTKMAYGKTMSDWLEEQKKIQALTAEDLMLVAQKYFDVDKLLVSVAHGKSLK